MVERQKESAGARGSLLKTGDVLEATGISKAYRGAGGILEVLRGLDLLVLPGEAVAVVGDSEVGKSTLLHVLGGIGRPPA